MSDWALIRTFIFPIFGVSVTFVVDWVMYEQFVYEWLLLVFCNNIKIFIQSAWLASINSNIHNYWLEDRGNSDITLLSRYSLQILLILKICFIREDLFLNFLGEVIIWHLEFTLHKLTQIPCEKRISLSINFNISQICISNGINISIVIEFWTPV